MKDPEQGILGASREFAAEPERYELSSGSIHRF